MKDRTTHMRKQCTSQHTFSGVLGVVFLYVLFSTTVLAWASVAEAQLRRCLGLLILSRTRRRLGVLLSALGFLLVAASTYAETAVVKIPCQQVDPDFQLRILVNYTLDIIGFNQGYPSSTHRKWEVGDDN
jgi:hypothetical protein